jgi:uncharacterized protein YdaU (DUF1376 family)
MSKRPVLPLWVADFLADTVGMTTAETGAYLLLLMAAWQEPSGSLPNNDRWLARSIRAQPKEWQRLRAVVLKYWVLGEDGRWRQKRLVEEIKKATEYSAGRRQNAKKQLKVPVDNPVDNPVETCEQLGCDPLHLEGFTTPGKNANKINGPTEHVYLTLNPTEENLSFAVGASGGAHGQQKEEKNKLNTDPSAPPTRRINYRQARQAWEATLRKGLKPDDYATVIDRLAALPALVERATAAEQREQGAGAQAIAMELLKPAVPQRKLS